MIEKQRQQQEAAVFPLVYSADDQLPQELPGMVEVQSWVASKRAELLRQLTDHGAVLLRGFPIQNHEDFDQLVQAFGLENFSYGSSLSNAVRHNRTERVFTANEAPPSVEIFLHHEMAQTPVFPSRLFFFCEQAPEQSGQTPLCRSDLLLLQLEKRLPEFVKSCEKLGVRYYSTMPAVDDPESGQGRSWGSTLSAQSKDQAETRLAGLNYQWQWLDQDSLQICTPVLSAIRQLAGGRRVFFNQLIAAYSGWQDKRNESRKSISFGDGSEISAQDMAQVKEMADALTFDLAWQSGDVAMVDNFLVMHGRRPYHGQRKVLASLVA